MKNKLTSNDLNEALKLNDKQNKLILEYNHRMDDDKNYPDKNAVRGWYVMESRKLISQGVPAFGFLYPDIIHFDKKF